MIERRSALAVLAAASSAGLLSALLPKPARAAATKPETIAVIGTGEVGSALGKRWAALGHTIIYGSRTPSDERVLNLVKQTGHGATATTSREAAAKAELILLALPWAATKEIVAGLGDMTGKIIMDPTNGIKVTEGRFEATPGLVTSGAEEIQSLVPGAHVVKVFNALSVEMMVDATRAGGDITVPIAGANAEAKARVVKLVEGMGLVPLDVGALYLARYLEDMARLRMAYRSKNRPNAFEFYLRPRKD